MPKLAEQMDLDTILHGALRTGLHAIGRVKGLSIRVSKNERIYILRKRSRKSEIEHELGSVYEMTLEQAVDQAQQLCDSYTKAQNDEKRREQDKERRAVAKVPNGVRRYKRCSSEKTVKDVIKDTLENPVINKSAALDQTKRSRDNLSLINRFICKVSSSGPQMGKYCILLDPDEPFKGVSAERLAHLYEASLVDNNASRDDKLYALILKLMHRGIALNCYTQDEMLRFQLLVPRTSSKDPTRVGHHYPCPPYELMPELIPELWNFSFGEGPYPRKYINENGLCYLLSILTLTRSQAVRMLQWQEIDFERRIWNIPIAHDKIKTPDHLRSIVLSSGAMAVLLMLKEMHGDCAPTDYVFISPRKTTYPNDAIFRSTMDQINRQRGKNGLALFVDPKMLNKKGEPRQAVQHGTARSTFSTWAADNANKNLSFRIEVRELCLQHDNAITRPYSYAYNRSEHIPDRQVVLEAWSDFLLSKCPKLKALAKKAKRTRKN